jgi:AcrR family transcriptional regulator
MMNDKASLTKSQILDVAMDCFTQHGYAKTNFQDIAKRAGISRATLYIYFKNKEDLFVTMDRRLHEKYVVQSLEILKSDMPNGKKLARIIDVWIVKPYRIIKRTPYPHAWLDELKEISKSEMRFRKLFIGSVTPLVGKPNSEIIVLAIRGLMDDRPSVITLKKRLGILISHFS